MSSPALPSALVVVGASAGGVEALRALVAGLPVDLDAAVLVVLHVPREGSSALPQILNRCGTLPVTHAVDGDPLVRGQVLVAPTDHHLIVSDGQVRLSHGPAENGHRPAVDPLFRSAARAWRERTIAVVLSGTRDDGTSGAVAVADLGGTVIVQDSDDALYPSMPRSAHEHVSTALALPAPAMGESIQKAVAALGPAEEPEPRSGTDLLAWETAIATMADITTDESNAIPAGFGCPTCHGALFELPGLPAPRFRCRVGHAWTAESLIGEQSAALEGALWMALRSLEEKASLSRRMAVAARERGNTMAAARFDATGLDTEQAGHLIRRLIGRLGGVIDLPHPDGTP
ncbi:chemotaxis protein CheB [Virgisporangium aurantiacum]|uniref:protein-glutamate methylesterase n=1 Tax=Virgisporangium aurantiacum TaxID=175570 RepID=A0A8J4E3C9_9ACTN|nr:chemotaxis protein CheB [Virgisporangium aurantiacum]GIJ59966.1 chemotaxis protein CheB [Virgisporangium aurantiacum]